MVVKDIALMRHGVEGLVLRDGERTRILPLRRGRLVSFQVTGPQAQRVVRDRCALCDGTRCLKGRQDCLSSHVLYLALFGGIAKVGVTKEPRYERRMREQGAQFAGRLSVHEDGMEARKAERLLASKGFRLNVRFEEKMEAFGEVNDAERANAIASNMPLPDTVHLSDMRGLYQNPGLECLSLIHI